MEILTLESDTMGFNVLEELLSSDYLGNSCEFDFFMVINTIGLTESTKNEMCVKCQIVHFGVCSVNQRISAPDTIKLNRAFRFFSLCYH